MSSSDRLARVPLLLLALLPLLAAGASGLADQTITTDEAAVPPPSTTTQLDSDFVGPLDSSFLPRAEDDQIEADYEGSNDSNGSPVDVVKPDFGPNDQLHFEQNLHGAVRMLKPLKPVPAAHA